MNLRTEDRGTILFVHRTSLFERCLDDLRGQGGTASFATIRVDEIIRNITDQENRPARERFRFTRKGEYRISKCRKIALGCGYRLVCIQKDCHLVLLYVGTHDDCFRWIERNKGYEYDIDDVTKAVQISCDRISHENRLPEDVLEERKFAEAYETALMSKIDDDVLYKVFPGLCKR
jgi:hypothetical protein